jgi:hypothetical protein
VLWRFSRDRRVHEELVQDVFVEAYLSLGRYRMGPVASRFRGENGYQPCGRVSAPITWTTTTP